MRQPGAVSRTVLALLWLVLGAAMVGVTVWVGWTRGRVILNGHPASRRARPGHGPAGVRRDGVGGRLARDRRPARPRGRPGPPRPAHPRPARAAGQGADPPRGAAPRARPLRGRAARLLPSAAPRSPGPPRRSGPRTASGSSTGSPGTSWCPSIEDARGTLVRPTTGLIFLPGARVDPQAYAPELRRVAQAGYLVVVLKEPFGFSIADRNHAADRSSRTTQRSRTGRSAVTRSAARSRPRSPTATGGWRGCCCSPPTRRHGRPHRPEGDLGLGRPGRAGHPGRHREVQGEPAGRHDVRGHPGRLARQLRRLRTPARRRHADGGPGRCRRTRWPPRPSTCWRRSRPRRSRTGAVALPRIDP